MTLLLDRFDRISRRAETTLVEILWPSASVSVLWRELFPLAHPAEEKQLAARRVHPNRVRDFRGGRLCARIALGRLGWGSDWPVLSAMSREPVWPEGVVGSITHCEGFAGAAVADSAAIGGLGIDIENSQRVTAELEAVILTPSERSRRPALVPPERWVSAHFSAKESIFKAVYPATRAFLEFHDVELTLEPFGKFTAAPARDGLPRVIELVRGAVAHIDGYVVAAAYFPRRIAD